MLAVTMIEGTEPLNQDSEHVSSTFNLDLTASQRDAKNKLELPHIKAQVTSGAINTVTASSAIHYSLECDDDFDDEDPDMDLEI